METLTFLKETQENNFFIQIRNSKQHQILFFITMSSKHLFLKADPNIYFYDYCHWWTVNFLRRSFLSSSCIFNQNNISFHLLVFNYLKQIFSCPHFIHTSMPQKLVKKIWTNKILHLCTLFSFLRAKKWEKSWANNFFTILLIARNNHHCVIEHCLMGCVVKSGKLEKNFTELVGKNEHASYH